MAHKIALLAAFAAGALAAPTLRSSNPAVVFRRDDFHTRPAMDPARMDFGDQVPSDIMAQLKDHCGDTTCDASWTTPAKYVSKGQTIDEGTINIEVLDAVFDGPDVRDGLIQGMIAMAKLGVDHTQAEYGNYCPGGDPFSCTSGSIDNYQSTMQYQLNRFKSDTTQAGTMTVRFTKAADGECSKLLDISKDVVGALGALGPVEGIAAAFFGTVLDLTCIAH